MLYLGRDSLISLAQASRFLNAVAVQHLHRTVPRLSGPDTIRCLSTFATAPGLAGKVRTFNIYSSFTTSYITALPPPRVRRPHKSIWDRLFAIYRPSKPPLPPAARPSLHFIAGTQQMSLQTIANAFYNMKNLHTLVVHAPSHPRIWEFEHPIPTLRTVFIHRNAESPSLLVWVMRQESITSLQMTFDRKRLQPPIITQDSAIGPSQSLPNLRSLTCNPQGVLDLFPGGRVSELIIEDLFEKGETIAINYLATVIASASAKSGIKLQRLTLHGAKAAIMHLVGRLEPLLPNLVFLRIFAMHCNADRVLLSLDELLPKLTRLETLECFVEAPSAWYTGPPLKFPERGLAEEEAQVKLWAEKCARLHVVRMPSHSKWWIRRSIEGLKVETEYPSSPDQ